MSYLIPKPSEILDSALQLVNELKNEDNWMNVDFFIVQTSKLVYLTEKNYPKDDLDSILPPFRVVPLNPRYTFEADRVKSVSAMRQCRHVMERLSTYLGKRVGDPVAIELLNDSISQALHQLQSGQILCSAFLARISLEQALKRLCSLHEIAFESKEKSASLNQKLRTQGVYQLYIEKGVTTQLDILNAAAHGNEVPKEEIESAIHWVDKFISNYLSGH